VVYSREIDGKIYTFGISGRLYKSNVLIYDHQTESLWSQLMEKAVTGPLAGKRLKTLPSTRSSWKAWKKKKPGTLVLSTDTGYERDYGGDPYKGYYQSLGIWFPVGEVRKDLSPKEMVLGIEVGGKARAYPLAELRKRSGTIRDEVGGEPVQITVTPDGEVTGVLDRDGNPIPPTFSYWFAWQAFHPETTVYR
jgi:hypothetical protein